MATGTYYCQYCPSFVAPSAKLLERHLKITHYNEPGFNFTCPEVSCTRVFSNYRTYQNHLLTHKNSVSSNTMIQQPVNIEEHDCSEISVRLTDTSAPSDEAAVNESYCEDTIGMTEEEMTDYCARWILKTSETRCLTRTAMVGIVHDVSDLIEEVMSSIREQVKKCLRDSSIEIDSIPGLTDIFTTNGAFIFPFSQLTTFQQQLSYYKEHYNFIVSFDY